MEQQVDSNDRRATRPVRVISAKVALAGAVVIAVLSGAVVSYAGGGGPFPDVPGSHPFATEIENMADAGITAGFSDGTFRPNNSVTRASMAAFLGRGMGRAGYEAWSGGNTTEVVTDGQFISLPYARLRPGAHDVPNAGYAVVTASVEVDRNSDTCPCSSAIFIQATKNNFSNIEFIGDTRNVDVVAGPNFWEMTTTAVITLSSDADEWRFRVRATNDATTFSGGTNTQFSGSISVVYVPYGFDGSQTLGT
jgi:hypothetical protein